MAIASALFLWLVAAWFSALSTLSVLRATRNGMRFALQWWAFVFPNAGLAIATIQIGNVLDSKGIKGVGAGITVILVPLWFMCAIFHIRELWNHELLAPGKDQGVDDVNRKHDEKQEIHEEKKEERREGRRKRFGIF
jgi:tellurite resistance protein TehA-like permease